MNRSSAKVSISLPRLLLRTADRARRETGESRSQFFRRAAEALLEERRRQEAVARYLAGYQAVPERPGELAWVAESGLAALAEEPWG